MAYRSKKFTYTGDGTKNNKPGDIIVSFDANKEEMYRKGLPKAIQQFVINDAPVNYAWISVYKFYRQYKSDALFQLQFLAYCDIKKWYGNDHPYCVRFRKEHQNVTHIFD